MGKLNGVLSKYEKQEQRMDALDKKMTLILEKLDELCQGSDQKESMESTDENRNIMVSSIDDINVETGSESEEKDVLEAKNKLKAIIQDVITGKKPDSNNKEWKLLVEIKEDKKICVKIRKRLIKAY